MIDRDFRLVAILRGIRTAETEAVVTALIESGFRAIEIPLNSPDPMNSIAAAVRCAERLAPGECRIGAGTVLTPQEVAEVKAAGGTLIVSPDANPEVIRAARGAGMVCLPGVFTPTEAHAALRAGASGLKFFPASQLGAAGIKAIRAILPQGTEIYAVGGVGPADFDEYLAAGVRGFGLGSNLYKPGASAEDVRAKAQEAISAMARTGSDLHSAT